MNAGSRMVASTPDICHALLLGAADVMEKRGLWQGTYEGPNGEVCLLGALEVAGETVGYCSIYNFCGALRRGCGLPEGRLSEGRLFNVKDIVAWNDAPGRTKDEVVKALRDAAGYL